METTMRACCQIPIKAEIRDVLIRLRHILRNAVTVIVSAREAQAYRRIQLYFFDWLIGEFEKAGKRMAKKDAID
jgi:hypothetical protein